MPPRHHLSYPTTESSTNETPINDFLLQLQCWMLLVWYGQIDLLLDTFQKERQAVPENTTKI